MVSRHGRSSKGLDLESLKNDINGIKYFQSVNLEERERLSKMISNELKTIYENKVTILREGSLSDISKVLTMEMSVYAALGMISKVQEMITLLEQFTQNDVDTQRLNQMEYEYLTKTQNRTIITEVDNEI